MFKPTYLYIKTHNKTGLKYFGKTVSKNPHKYKGSGSRWGYHLKAHGNDVSTEIFGYYINESDCVRDALKFSTENDIVNSDNWANLEPEDGLSGGFGTLGQRNSQFGTVWITNGLENAKISKDLEPPEGWRRGRIVPIGWGDNVRSKLKGRSHKELLGEEKAAELSALKSKLGKARYAKIPATEC
jgi:hypothetical protein